MQPLKIFEIEENGTMRFHLNRINQVVDRVPRCKPIMIVSIIGTKRLGKSYVLNRLLRIFKDSPGDSRSIGTQSQRQETFFESNGGFDRVTTGIDIWPEPIILPHGLDQIALLVLDCQGDYDQNTDPRGNNVVYSIAHLLSSFVMFNTQGQIDENILHRFVYLSEYVRNVHKIAPELSLSSPNLLFLIRDFQFEEPFGLGLSESGDGRYYDSVFSGNARVPLENQALRQKILDVFNRIVMFMLPNPGREFVKDSRDPDEDFVININKLANYILGNVEPKRVGNNEVSRDDLKEILGRLHQLCENGKFPRAETIGEMYTELDKSRKRLKLVKNVAIGAAAGVVIVGGAYMAAPLFMAGAAAAEAAVAAPVVIAGAAAAEAALAAPVAIAGAAVAEATAATGLLGIGCVAAEAVGSALCGGVLGGAIGYQV